MIKIAASVEYDFGDTLCICSLCEKLTESSCSDLVSAVALEILPNVKVATKAIPGCAVRFVNAVDAREQIEFTANIDLSQFGGALPADDFYYVAE